MDTHDQDQHADAPSSSEQRTDDESKRASNRRPQDKAFIAPLVLSIVALIAGLCGQALPFVGAVIGIATLVVRHIAGVPRDQQKAPRATTVLAVLGILFSLILTFYRPQPGTITLTVDAPDWQAAYGTVSIEMSGTTSDGQTAEDTLELTPNKARTLDGYQVGTYTFTIDDNDLTPDDERFETNEPSVTCDLGFDQNVDVTISLALVPKDGVLTFVLDGTHAPDNAAAATVAVQGTTNKGEEVSDTFTLAFGDTYDLNGYVAGDYTFSVDPASFTVDDTVYAVADQTCTFDQYDDVTVTAIAMVDEQATQELAEQRAAEAKAKAEAEAKAKAEAEAKAKAEAQAQQEAAAAKVKRQQEAASEPIEQTVYITNTGSKYHRSWCRHLRQSSHAISLSNAKAQGYTPCKVCKPPQ